MRRYHRAVLAFVAALSVLALLFYRHEYNRLRYVLEVFNYFGRRPGEMTNCSDTADALFDKLRNRDGSEYHRLNFENFNGPIPAWQRMTDDIYTYSSYRTNHGEINTIALVRQKSLQLSSLSCGIIYENEVARIDGIFTYKPIEERVDTGRTLEEAHDYSDYLFACHYEGDVEKSVASVKFWLRSHEKNDNEIRLAVGEGRVLSFDGASKDVGEKVASVAALCIAPYSDLRAVVDEDIFHFLVHHVNLGVARFTLYDFGVSPRLNKLAERILSSEEVAVSYTTLPWNVPFTKIPYDTIRRIVEMDCLLRTTAPVNIVATLSLDEYIVLEYHRSLDKLFRDIEKIGYKADRYQIPSMNFCVDRGDSIEKRILVARDPRPEVDHPVYVYRRPRIPGGRSPVLNRVISTRETTADLIVAKRYERSCGRTEGLEVVSLDDRYSGKFSKTIENSNLYKLFHRRTL